MKVKRIVYTADWALGLRLWKAKVPQAEIARRLRVSQQRVSAYAMKHWGKR